MRFILLTFAFLACNAFAQLTAQQVDSVSRFKGFTTLERAIKTKQISGDFKVKKSSVVEIEDMPRVRDQGGFDICYAVSTYYIAQHHHCANVLKGRPGYVSCVEATKDPAK
jgi:hypothetical protein